MSQRNLATPRAIPEYRRHSPALFDGALAQTEQGDNHSEIHHGQHGTSHELPPLLLPGPELTKRHQTRADEHEVADAATEHRERIKPAELAGSQKDPEHPCSRLKEVGDEQ